MAPQSPPMSGHKAMHPNGCTHCHHAGAGCCPSLHDCCGQGLALISIAALIYPARVIGNPPPQLPALPHLSSLAYVPPLRPPAV